MFDKVIDVSLAILIACALFMMVGGTVYMLVYIWLALGRLLAGGC